MVERIDFYILAAAGSREQAVFACRLCEKAYDQGLRTFVRIPDEQWARAVDEMLWVFRAGSFLPHARAPRGQEPILIGDAPDVPGNFNLLINLAADVPGDWERYSRIAEIIDQQREVLERGRERFRIYRDSGYSPQYHKLEG